MYLSIDIHGIMFEVKILIVYIITCTKHTIPIILAQLYVFILNNNNIIIMFLYDIVQCTCTCILLAMLVDRKWFV